MSGKQIGIKVIGAIPGNGGTKMPYTRAHIIIKGRVQGVCFRAETQYEANRSGMNGWVRNLKDGNVEAVFEGEESAVEGMVQWCGHGPSAAVVTDVLVEREDYTGEFDRFSIEY